MYVIFPAEPIFREWQDYSTRILKRNGNGIKFKEFYETINFTNASSNGGSFEWDFNDGGASGDENPAHTYLINGIYNVQLIVYDENNCKSDTIVKTVNVFPTGIENELDLI